MENMARKHEAVLLQPFSKVLTERKWTIRFSQGCGFSASSMERGEGGGFESEGV